MIDEHLHIVPTPAQADFINAVLSGRYTLCGYGGGIRGGKTYGVLLIIRILLRLFPGSRAAIVRRDLPTLRRNTLPSMKKLGIHEPNHDTWTVTFDNGSQLIMFPESLDTDPDMNRWKGLEVNWIVMEEANELAEKSKDMAVQRAGAYIIPGRNDQPHPLVLCTFNPSPGWVKSTFYDPWVKGELEAPFYFRQALMRDNPHLPEAYIKQQDLLPEWDYKRYVKGEWDQLTGKALTELDRKVHFIKPFNPPAHWRWFGAFDWGFRHLWCAGGLAINEDGRLFVADTVRGRQHQPPEIAERIKHALPVPKMGIIYAGHDLWNEKKAEGYTGPTLSEQFIEKGIVCTKANISRIQGLGQLRKALAWRKKGPATKEHPEGAPDDPDLMLMDTPGNQWLFEQLQSMTLDPTSGEDVLKVDADEHGRGGDDGYDMLRYAVASRAGVAEDYVDPDLNLNSPLTRAIEAAAQRRVHRPIQRGPNDGGINHPELGGYV